MKIYISIPISGRPLIEARHHAERLKAKLSEHGHQCITPFDICDDPDKPYAYYIGRDIESLLSDDIEGVVFGIGFHDSKGCMLEQLSDKTAVRRIFVSGRRRVVYYITASKTNDNGFNLTKLIRLK